MAGEQKPVSGLDLIGEAHEQQRVAGESEGHSAADDFWTLLHVTDGGDGQAPVCHRAPEMCAEVNEDATGGADAS